MIDRKHESCAMKASKSTPLPMCNSASLHVSNDTNRAIVAITICCFVRTADLMTAPQTLVFGTLASQLIFPYQEPRSKPKKLLKVFARSAIAAICGSAGYRSRGAHSGPLLHWASSYTGRSTYDPVQRCDREVKFT